MPIMHHKILPTVTDIFLELKIKERRFLDVFTALFLRCFLNIEMERFINEDDKKRIVHMRVGFYV